MTGARMLAETFEILRHVEVHGPRTRPEVASGLRHEAKDVTSRLNNLVAMGYLARDETTTPICYTLTKKARVKLSEPFTPAPPPTPRKPRARREVLESPLIRPLLRRQEGPRPVQPYGPRRRREGESDRLTAPYRAEEYQASLRPGAMVAFALPSRFGDQLHYRDGRVTDMDGHPIE